MNTGEIIRNIEAEQMKAEVPEFHVGDTVKVYGRIKAEGGSTAVPGWRYRSGIRQD